MRVTPYQLDDPTFRRAIDRLEALPVRAAVAREVFAVLTAAADLNVRAPAGALPLATEIDPGWTLARSRATRSRPFDPTTTLIEHNWWPSTIASPTVLDALNRLWRHSVVVAFGARRLGREANDPDPDRLARAGLLHQLALWALAAVDPERLPVWIAAGPLGRLALEHRWFGADLSAVGRRLAERWGCDPLVADAAWLHADSTGDLNECAAEPDLVALIQASYAQARRTPWSLDPVPERDLGPTEPKVRILTAEVQSRTSVPFIDPDASPREEALTRDNLRLRRALARAEATGSAAARLVASLAETPAGENPQSWADRVALDWSHEPGLAAARIVWRPADEPPAGALTRLIETETTPEHPPTSIHPLGDPGHPVADLLLWDDPGLAGFRPIPSVLAGWNGWARLVAERDQLDRRLDRAVQGHRGRVSRDETTRRRALLDGLAEFAAGAGHELNNPLAVIMGRAQLVLARSPDAETTRSLRAIITQAQRAHRILRDLMFVARPSEFRPRACQPDEIVRASLRDLQDEAETQGVRLVLEARDPTLKVWADPEPLRQVADTLTRNALEASSSGATIRFATGGDARQVRWTVHDSGRGITAIEGAHLFDPFYCGRQAGRGLGLGLPRARRIVDQMGGDLRWQSTPGLGSAFHVTLPVDEIPGPVAPGRPEPESGSTTSG